MDNLKEYKCPSCGAPMAFEVGKETLACENCGGKIPVAMLETIELGSNPKNGFDWGDYKKTLTDERLEDTHIYICKSCGAQIETSKTTAATNCPYCGNNVLLTDRVGGSLRPNVIIPFQITPDTLPAAVKHFYKNKHLLPRGFFSKSKLSKIQGVYIPFWLYSCRLEGNLNLRGSIARTYSDAEYDYTEVSSYLLAREGEMAFENIPADASVKMRNDLMDSLEPYDFSELVDFNSGYLAGFVADRFDRSPDTELKRANRRMLGSAAAAFTAAESDYNAVAISSNAMKMVDASVKYALLPVYLINCEYEGKAYQYAVNGQTGKVIGDLPISKARVREFFFASFGIAAAIACALAMWLQ